MANQFDRLRTLQPEPPVNPQAIHRSGSQGQFSPAEAQRIDEMLSIVAQLRQPGINGQQGEALRANAVPNPEEVIKAKVEAELDKEIEKGKEANTVKKAMKSSADLRELRRKKFFEQQEQ